MTTFNHRAIRELRAGRHWTLDEVAKRAGVTDRTVLYIERGVTTPRADTLAKLATAFEVPIGVFFLVSDKA